MSLLTQQQQKFSRMVGQLFLYAKIIDYGITLGEVWRSEEEQARLFEAGFSKIKTFGQHQKRLAIDLNIFINDVFSEDIKHYNVLADYWKGLDPENVWGGDWRGNFFGINGDYHHFQLGK